MSALNVALAPKRPGALASAILDAGASLAPVEEAELLVWFGGYADKLRETIERGPRLRVVQLPSAGVEWAADVLDDRFTWLCAKGVYGRVVAEHGLALMLAAARHLHVYLRATSWPKPVAGTLHGTTALVLGGGGIARELVAMLDPLGVRCTVVRKHLRPVPGADVTIGPGDVHDALPTADWVVVAAALTPETTGMVDERFLDRMRSSAWLVNLARGRHVVTDALVAALGAGSIGGAALDVTDPEPLPDGHPLWEMPNVVITPHVANHWDVGLPLLAERVRDNLRRYLAGEPLVGVVDLSLGY